MLQRQILALSGIFFLFLLFCFNPVAYAGQYTVKKGDSLYSISKQLGISIDEIKNANHLGSDKLKPGQSLSVKEGALAPQTAVKPKPQTAVKSRTQSASSYTVQKGDTLSTIAKKTGVPLKQIVALNHVQTRNLRIGRKLILTKPTPAAASAADEEEDLLDEEEEDAEPSDPSANILCEEKAHEELLGKWGSAEERKLFVKVTTGFLGAPYRLGGATVRGIDCSAFVRKMYEFFDITLPRTAREQSAVGVQVSRDQLVEGDLVFFRTRKPIGHVGIYIGNNEFVHASYKAKAVRIDNLDQPYFQKRFQRAVRVKGLDDHGGT